MKRAPTPETAMTFGFTREDVDMCRRRALSVKMTWPDGSPQEVEAWCDLADHIEALLPPEAP